MNLRVNILTFLKIAVISIINNVQCEVFTSTSAMEGLLHIEANLISEISSYLAIERDKLEQLRK